MVLVECSASPIEPDADLYSMSIFRLHHGVPAGPVASLRPWKDECLTSSSFSSCHVDQRNVRHTKLRTIVSVAGLGEHERRAFGCNVTYSRRDGAMRKLSWSIAVEREYLIVSSCSIIVCVWIVRICVGLLCCCCCMCIVCWLVDWMVGWLLMCVRVSVCVGVYL